MEYIVIENHKTDYPNPITVKKGEEIIIEKEYDGDKDWSNWMFCIKTDGSNKGWIPKQIIKHENSRNIIVEDYSARELNVEKGSVIEGIQETNGWLWSFSQNPVGFGKSLGKSGLKPAFSGKFKVAFPKTEVLGKPLWSKNKETNETGWIPVKKTANIEANMDKRKVLT